MPLQPFETATLVLFLVSYLYSSVRAIFAPEGYRNAEVQFYKTGTSHRGDLVMMIVGVVSLPTLIVHVAVESLRIGEILLYAQVVMFAVVFPLHFTSFMRTRMVKTLSGKSNSNYRNSGLKKVFIALCMVVLPFILSK